MMAHAWEQGRAEQGSTGQHQFCMQRALLYAWIQECRMIMCHSCVVFWQRRVHTKIDMCRVSHSATVWHWCML
jgi:hypothetical protein